MGVGRVEGMARGGVGERGGRLKVSSLSVSQLVYSPQGVSSSMGSPAMGLLSEIVAALMLVSEVADRFGRRDRSAG